MARRTVGVVVGVALAGVAVFAGLRAVAPAAEAAPSPAALRAHGTPVLVELFTSEGCSSCPPADDVAARLSRTQPVPGAHVIVLAHHVDYWNELGWPDPFSSPIATSRQRAYAALGGGTYTPQAVVDGRAQVVGSRGAALEQSIAASAGEPHARVDLEVVSTPPAGAFEVTVRMGPVPESATSDAEVLLAVVQDRGRVKVPRGENGGRTLDHVAIARSVKTLGGIAKAGGAARSVVHVPAAVSAPEGTTFSVAAFVQERSNRRVLGAATAPLATR